MSSINSTNKIKNDGYDRGIIPAETKARMEREGDTFKQHPDSDSDTGLDTTGGYTVSREGLINNYAVEPEMYYEKRGDIPKEDQQPRLKASQSK